MYVIELHENTALVCCHPQTRQLSIVFKVHQMSWKNFQIGNRGDFFRKVNMYLERTMRDLKSCKAKCEMIEMNM